MDDLENTAARYMTRYQCAAESSHAAQAMWLGALVAGSIDRIRGLLQHAWSRPRKLIRSTEYAGLRS